MSVGEATRRRQRAHPGDEAVTDNHLSDAVTDKGFGGADQKMAQDTVPPSNDTWSIGLLLLLYTLQGRPSWQFGGAAQARTTG